MKGFIFALVAASVMAVVLPSPALAASPHFINASAKLQGTSLVVSWKEAGLGNNVVVHYVASANATAQYACINGGGNHPKATNKATVNGPVSASGEFSSGKNGSINGSLTLSPPGAGAFSCPSGQRMVLAQVTYSTVAIRDVSNGVTENIAGTFCGSFVNLPEFAC